MTTARRMFYPGDPAPWFMCRSSNNDRFYLNTLGGRYLVLSFLGSAADPRMMEAVRFVSQDIRHHFNDNKITFFGVSVDPEDEKQVRMKQLVPGIRFFWDFDCEVSKLYGAIAEEVVLSGQSLAYHPFTLVIDPFLRVIANIAVTDPKKHNEILAQVLRTLPPIDDHGGVPIVAPVLVLPRVFEPEFCRQLIGLYEEQGGVESGFMREKDGKTVGILNSNFKRRKDFKFDIGQEYEDLRRAIQARLSRRLVPEIQKAFQFKVTRLERYLVACYDGESGGFFNAHRDNTTKGTAHRRFACTINLNAEEFEGGELRFPEFGSRSYRAPTGGAVVFSCSLLHEALPVTSGKRYAFLPFLFDEEAQEIRKENSKFIAEEMIDQNVA